MKWLMRLVMKASIMLSGPSSLVAILRGCLLVGLLCPVGAASGQILVPLSDLETTPSSQGWWRPENADPQWTTDEAFSGTHSIRLDAQVPLDSVRIRSGSFLLYPSEYVVFHFEAKGENGKAGMGRYHFDASDQWEHHNYWSFRV